MADIFDTIDAITARNGGGPAANPLTRPGAMDGEFTKGMRSGGLGAMSQINATLGGVGQAAGADDFARGRFAAADEYGMRAGEAAPRVGRIRDIGSLRDAVDYGTGMLGQMVPTVLPALGAAALTGGGAIPGMLAAAGTAAPLEIGDVIQRQRGENGQGPIDLGAAALSGGGSALMQGVVPGLTVAKAAGKVAANGVARSALGSMAQDAALGGAGEAVKQRGAGQAFDLADIGEAAAANAVGALPMAAIQAGAAGRQGVKNVTDGAGVLLDKAKTKVSEGLAGAKETAQGAFEEGGPVRLGAEGLRKAMDTAKSEVDKVAEGIPLVDPAELASATGEKLNHLIQGADGQRFEKVKQWAEEMLSDNGLPPERRQELAEAAKDFGSEASALTIATAKKAWDKTKAEATRAKDWLDSLQGSKESPTDVKKSEDYSGLNQTIKDVIMPALKERHGETLNAETINNVGVGVRHVLRDLMKTGRVSERNHEMLTHYLGDDGARTALQELHGHVADASDKHSEAKLYEALNGMADESTSRRGRLELLRKSARSDNLSDHQLGLIDRHISSYLDGTNRGDTPAKRQYEEREFRAALEKGFGKNADKVLSAYEGRNNEAKVLENEHRRTLEADEQVDAEGFGPDAMSDRKVDAVALMNKPKAGEDGRKPIARPRAVERDWADAKIKEVEAKNPDMKARFVTADEYRKVFGQDPHDPNSPPPEGKGYIVMEKFEPKDHYDEKTLSSLRYDTDKGDRRSDKRALRTNPDAPDSDIIDAAKLTRQHRLEPGAGDLNGPQRDARAFMTGVARLQEHLGRRFDIPDDTIINERGMTYAEAKSTKLTKASNAERASSLRLRAEDESDPKMKKATLEYADRLEKLHEDAKSHELTNDPSVTRDNERVQADIIRAEEQLQVANEMVRDTINQWKKDQIRWDKDDVKHLHREFKQDIEDHISALKQELEHVERNDAKNAFSFEKEGKMGLDPKGQIHEAGLLGKEARVERSEDGSSLTKSTRPTPDSMKANLDSRIARMEQMKGVEARDVASLARAIFERYDSLGAMDKVALLSLIKERSLSAAKENITGLAAKLGIKSTRERGAELRAALDKKVAAGDGKKVLGTYYVESDRKTMGGTLDGTSWVNMTRVREDFAAGMKYPFENEQKKLVMEKLSITPEVFKENITSVKDYAKFIRDHERSHVRFSDDRTYPKTADGKLDLTDPRALAIEARATAEAWTNAGGKLSLKARTWAETGAPMFTGERPKAGSLDASRADTAAGANSMREVRGMKVERATVDPNRSARQLSIEGTETLHGEPPGPKAVAAKKAALVEKARSGDPELLKDLSESDDAKGLQRAVEHLLKHDGTEKAIDAATKRLGELVRDADTAYGMSTKKYSLMSTEMHEKSGRIGFAATHDSPHRFDSFNWRENLGRGEGNQAFGAGTYLSTAEGVHKYYKKAFSEPARYLQELEDALEIARSPKATAAEIREGAREYIRESMRDLDDSHRDGHHEALRMLEKLTDPQLKGEKSPTYHVTVEHDPKRMLNWNKPLSEQTASVRLRAMKAIKDNGLSFMHEELGAETPGRYDLIKTDSNAVTGEQLYKALTEKLGSQRAASDYLQSLGIPGHEYAAAAGRIGKAPNYVIYDDSKVSTNFVHFNKMRVGYPTFDSKYANDWSRSSFADDVGPVKNAYIQTYKKITDGSLEMRVIDRDLKDGSSEDRTVLTYEIFTNHNGKKEISVDGPAPGTAAFEKYKHLLRTLTQGETDPYNYLEGADGSEHGYSKFNDGVFPSSVNRKLLRTLRDHAEQLGALPDELTFGRETGANPGSAYRTLTREELRAFDMSQARPGGRAQTQAEQAAVDVHIKKVLGPSVKTAFENIFHAGEFERTNVGDIIRLSVHSLDPMSVAHHESLHGFFQQLRDAGANDVMGVLHKAADGASVRKQLEKLLANEPDALKQLKDSEERVAYMYQFWKAGKLNVGPETKSMLNKVADFLRQVLGIWSNDERALHIMDRFQAGDWNADRSAFARSVMETHTNKTLDSITKPLNNLATQMAVSGGAALQDSGIQALRTLGEMAKGKLHAEGDDPGFIPAARIERSRVMNELSRSLGNLNVTEAHMAEALADLQGRKLASSTEARLAVRTTRKVLDDVLKYMQSAGVSIDKIKGSQYFPRVYDADYVTRHAKDFRTVLEKNGLTPGEANRVMLKIINADGNEFQIETLRPGDQHAKQRTLAHIPDKELERFMSKNYHQIMNSYITQGTRRAEWARRFGDDNAKANALLREAKEQGATPEQLAHAEKFIRGVNGTLGDDINPSLRRLQGNMIVYQNVRLLPLAIFSMAIDPMGLVVRGGTIKDALHAYKRGITESVKSFQDNPSKDAMTSLSETLGVIDDAVLQHTLGTSFSQGMVGNFGRKINDTFFRYNMVEQANRSMRVAATAASLKFLERHADGTADVHSKRWLSELGLQPGDVQMKNGRIALTEADGLSPAQALKMRLAVNKWVDGAVLRPDAVDKPVWMNDPHFALIAHLKQFVFSFHETVLKRVMHEYEHGNYKPAMALASYVPVMIAADLAKGVIQGGGSQPEWKDKWGAEDYVWSGVQRAGLLGVGQFAVDAADGRATGLLGPTIEQFTDAAAVLEGRAAFRSFLLKSMPANALYAAAAGGTATDPTFAE